MRRRLPIVAAGLAILAVAPPAAAVPLQTPTGVTIHVAPGTGGTRTTFKVSLRNPAQPGTMGTLGRFDELAISGPHRSRCVWSGGMTLPSAAPNQVVRAVLSPARLGNGRARGWCVGTFHGSVVQTTRFMCGPPQEVVCPMLEVRPQTIATFSFTVTRRS